MSNVKIYRRNLPHIHPDDGIIFITFRLYGTIPRNVLKRLLKEKEQRLREIKNKSGHLYFNKKYKIEKRFFADYDNWLDTRVTESSWLERPEIANIINEKIHRMDGKNYHLIACCIMPNHVHILIKQNKQKVIHMGKTRTYPVADALRLLKGSTARKCNLILKRNGTFWHHESYDHVVRNENELNRIVEYIKNNPVKAGIVKSSNDWKYFYYNPEIIL